MEMSTKLKGDIAEQAVILYALRQGWGVSVPVGDRHPYDVIFDIEGKLVKIQVKAAWLSDKTGNFVIDNRRTKTNRREMKHEGYGNDDFDFAVAYIEPLDLFYVFPSHVFISYGSEIHMVENDRRQRRPRSAEFRDAWHLISESSADQFTETVGVH